MYGIGFMSNINTIGLKPMVVGFFDLSLKVYEETPNLN